MKETVKPQSKCSLMIWCLCKQIVMFAVVFQLLLDLASMALWIYLTKWSKGDSLIKAGLAIGITIVFIISIPWVLAPILFLKLRSWT